MEYNNVLMIYSIYFNANRTAFAFGIYLNKNSKTKLQTPIYK